MQSQPHPPKYPRFRSRGGEEFELNLERAQIPRLELPNTYLPFARFCGAKLVGADFSDAILADADFREAILKHADFSRADLTNASFEGADLEGANFEGAILAQTSFDQAELAGTNFCGVNLQTATGLSAFQFLASKQDDETKLAYELERDVDGILAQEEQRMKEEANRLQKLREFESSSKSGED